MNSASPTVGTEGRSLAGWNQLVGCRNRIVDLGNNLQNQVLGKLRHSRPVFDVRSELDFYRRICHTLAVEDTVLVNLLVEVVCRLRVCSGELVCCGQESLVCCLVAAMERASIRATEEIWPFWILDPRGSGSFW